VRRRIFEPLFTTKSRASRRGRGLGMSIVYNIVRHSGGFVQIDSEPGHGTRIRVYLPISGAAVLGPEVHSETSAPVQDPRAKDIESRSQLE